VAALAARGVDPSSSPAPLLLAGPLTALAALAAAGVTRTTGAASLAVLGARREVDGGGRAWLELGAWLPDTDVDVTFIGPDVPPDADDGRPLPSSRGRVTLRCVRGVWHALALPPHTAGVALDAGLAAYETWGPTLAAWPARERGPLVVTEHCEEAARLAAAAARAAVGAGVAVAGPSLNEFRCPVLCGVAGTRLPAACSGWRVVVGGKGRDEKM
jgi:hypothetical protein